MKSPCSGCKRKSCLIAQKPCRKVEALLPGMQTGRTIKNRMPIAFGKLKKYALQGIMQDDIRPRMIAFTRTALDNFRFPSSPWTQISQRKAQRIAEAYLWEGRQAGEIAKTMHTSEGTIRRIAHLVLRKCNRR